MPAPFWLLEHGFRENFAGRINPRFRELFERFWQSGYTCVTADADRRTIISGIGRGTGRSAAHEFAHQLLSGVPLHSGKDPNSYELRWADRAAQFYGPMHWEFAGPLLLERLGPADERQRPPVPTD